MSQDFAIGAAIKQLGGSWHTDAEGQWWRLDRNGFVLEAEPWLEVTAEGTRIAFNCAIEHRELAAVANRIMGDPVTQFVSMKAYVREFIGNEGESIEQLIERSMMAVVTEFDSEQLGLYVERFRRERPDGPSLKQIYHLAALAWSGNFATLDDYLQLFRKGKRLNFVPFVEDSMIERAVDIAAERMA